MVIDRPLRLVFFGTPAFAVPTLDALLASRHPIVGVVTQPDRPRGRGRQTTDAPVKARALAAGLRVLQPAALKEAAFMAGLAELRADLGVVAAYGKILPEAILAAPRLGMVNVHASLLPKYRGAAPVHRAVIAGERETGVTIMRVVKALDAGPMLAWARRPIDAEETSLDVERDLARLGAALLVATVDRLAGSDVPGIAQEETAATYAHRLTKEDGLIDWSRSAVAIHDLVRGLHPWPHAFTYGNLGRLIVLRSAPVGDQTTAGAGTVVVARGDDLHIATGSGLLALRMVQIEGKRPVSPRELLAGHRLAPGDRFTAAP